jgi:2-polyprenyl-3-methyl-5-hydroxy-6-metoxy-1,4-benzoquinol methylase
MKTKDPVNKNTLEALEQDGTQELGLMNNAVWAGDPRRLVFTLARYKFVAKMFEGKGSVLEVGCGDGFGSRIVKQSVQKLTITDYDELFIKDFLSKNKNKKWPIEAVMHDILAGPMNHKYSAAYTLDVLEHIPQAEEGIFIENICKSLDEHGVLILGMPSLESQSYASPQSIDGHINCKSGEDLSALMKKYFHNVFLFSMNDEVVHTGYSKMAHYILTVCVNPK